MRPKNRRSFIIRPSAFRGEKRRDVRAASSPHSKTLLPGEAALEVRVVPLPERNRDRGAGSVAAIQRWRQRTSREHGFGLTIVDANQTTEITEPVAGQPEPVGALLVKEINRRGLGRRGGAGH